MNALERCLLGASIALAGLMLGEKPALASACAPDMFEDVKYTICRIEPGKADLRLFWKNDRDQPYRNFSRVADAVREEGKSLTFALNGGMYDDDFAPTGLYIEDGAELRPANTASVEGPPAKIPNFYKKPNGVFYLGDGGAGILPTGEFLAQKPEARFATQSGPMLVIGGKLHPAFIVGSGDRTRRSGVGVCTDGAIIFAISDFKVNFHDFARLFRDHLHCPDALFLDGGNGAGIYNPAMRLEDWSWHGGYGPIFGLVE